jgi:Domain of unknown function (DUF4129)
MASVASLLRPAEPKGSHLGMQRSSSTTATVLATAGLVVAVVVVAIAARVPLSRSTPVDASAAQAPTTALFVLLIGAGVVMLGALAAVAWSGRRRKDDPPEHEPTPIEVPWIWKLLGILLPCLVGAALVTAAILGARSVRTTPRSGGVAVGPIPLRARSTAGTAAGFTVPAWLPWTVLAIIGVGVAAGVFGLWVRRGRARVEESKHAATSAALEAAVGALVSDRDPRRAVIAAYAAMQRTLDEHGVARSPAEAPREYLRRVLIANRATEREATTLTDLFEEARYSAHPIPERVRDVALAALRSLQSRLHTGAAN